MAHDEQITPAPLDDEAVASAPPVTPDDELMFAEKPPVWPKVIGIISIVFASFGLLCGVGGTAAAVFVMPRIMSSASGGGDLPPTMQFGMFDYAAIVLSLLISLLLLFAGISTVARATTGRTLHLAYAVVSIPLALFGTGWNIVKIGRLEQWIIDNPNHEFVTNGAVQSGAVNYIGPVIGLVIGLSWPLFVMFWFGVVKRRAEDMTGGVEDVA